MKKIQGFREGESIPSSAKFIGMGENVFWYEVTERESSPKAESKEDAAKGAAAVAIAHLNEMTGKQFKANSKETMSLIRGLINRGFSENDMLQAINNMVASWGDDPKWSTYLRPSTLFRASKFENYLNTKSTAQEAADAFAELEGFCS